MIGRSTWGAVVALAACIALLLGAGVVGALTVEEPEASASARPGPLADQAVTQAPPPPPLDLAALVVPGPTGFDRIPDESLVAGGAADVDKLAAERTDQARSRAVFAETGLVNGFVRAWQRPATGELVTVRLYQFADAEGAKSYAAKITSVMTKAPATTFAVPATRDTTGIDTTVAQGPNRLVHVVSWKDRVVAAFAVAVVPPPDTSFLPPMVRSQLSLLP